MREYRPTIRTAEAAPTRMMRERVLLYAIVASVVAHLVVVGFIAKSFASRLSAPSAARTPRYIKVNLVDLPESKPAPKAAVRRVRSVPETTPLPKQPVPPLSIHTRAHAQPSNVARLVQPVAPNTPRVVRPPSQTPRPIVAPRTPGNPGGRLNVGSTSSHGDLGGGWNGGRTPMGWVPSGDGGPGSGSGRGVGEGTPDPPRHADDGPGTRPAPAPPAPPPAPTMIAVKVCSESGELPGEYCRQTRTQSYVEGRQPTRRCGRCKPPEPEHRSRLADRAEPVLIRDSRPSIPDSVDEGLSVTVKIEYTITADGDVSGVQIVKSSGIKAIDRAVVDSAQRLKYQPAIQDGVPRSVKRTRQYSINT